MDSGTSCFAVGDQVVRVYADTCRVAEVLGEFYPPVTAPAGMAGVWTVTASSQPGPSGASRNAFGVTYSVNRAERTVRLWSVAEEDVAVTARKVIREILLEQCEAHRYTMVHASAVWRDDAVVVFAADKRGGKTTLALRAVLEHGWRLLSNDHLILYRDDAVNSLVATSLPTPIPVKVGTFLDLEGHLPEPWDRAGVDMEAFRAMPREDRYRYDTGVYFTYRRLGQDNPVLVPLRDRRVVFVFPSYGTAKAPVGLPEAVSLPEASVELGRHVRWDWVGDRQLNQRHLPRVERDQAAFLADGARLTAGLARVAEAVRWRHAGDPAALLDALGLATRVTR
jgi:hypothetical protein